MVNAIIWRENRPLLEEMAHRTLEHKPHTAQMLAILSANVPEQRVEKAASS